jgi:hypothetical protein
LEQTVGRFHSGGDWEGSQSSGQKIDGVDEENVALAAKGKGKKKGNSGRDLSKVRCYCCNQLGHLASQCPERKKKKKEHEGPDTTATTTMEDFSSKFDKEFSLVTLVSSVGSGGFGGDNRWIVDSGASCHMTRIWRVFLIITETGPDGWWRVKEVWHELYVELEGLDSDSSMGDSWRLMEFSLFQG